MLDNKGKIYFLSYFIAVLAIVVISIPFLNPAIVIESDAATYLQAMSILDGQEPPPPGYVPNRILNTFVSLQTVILLSKIFGSIELGWLLMNLFFYLAITSLFYFLVRRLFGDDRVALVAGLFFAANYGLVSFGLGYWMDVGSWLAYIASLYFVLRYLETGSYRNVLYSAIIIGLGATFKEYALLGTLPIAVAIIYQFWPKIGSIIGRGLPLALISIVPVTAIYVWVFYEFGYTYADWLSANSAHYVYGSRIIEYIKSSGSLYTFLVVPVIMGIHAWYRNGKDLLVDKKHRIFIYSAVLSVAPVLLWPGITQRTSFITVPVAILFASFCFKKYEKYWWVWIPVLILYLLATIFMDSFLLVHIDLPF